MALFTGDCKRTENTLMVWLGSLPWNCHAHGGKPDKRSPLFKVTEGQSDYWGAKDCLEEVLRLTPQTDFAEATAYESFLCTDSEDIAMCERLLLTGRRIGALLSFIKDEPIPNYETPDQTVVNRTLKSYPDSIQCRLDTYLAGFQNQDRPRCWYKP